MGDVNSATHPFSAELSYAGNGRITQAEMRNNASPATYKRYRYAYGYDASNQLTSADYSFWVPGSGWQTSSNYDIPAITYNKSGNIITLKRRNQSGSLSDDATYYLQSGKNRIQYILDNGGGGAIDNIWYDHDVNGNLIFTENFDSGQLHELTYDPSNRLVRVQELGYSDVTDYRISASGWRYWSKAGTANATYSPRDGSSPLGEFTVGSYPFTWTLRRPDGSVYGRKAYNNSSEFFWTDPLGSVRVRTSNSGSLLEAHDYYPFGLDMPGRSSTGTPVRQGFTGYWRDSESSLNLYYSGARMYSPGTGRFFGVDPLAEEFATWSPYVYTFNNPVNWRDPDGRSAKSLRDIILLKDNQGAGPGNNLPGFGHNAVLVGDNKTGWVYYSKDGPGEGGFDHSRIPFTSIKEAFNSPELERYDEGVYFETSPEDDKKAVMALDGIVKGKYNLGGSNCADLCNAGLKMSGIDLSNTNSKSMGITHPRLQFNAASNRSDGYSFDVKKIKNDLNKE